MFAFHSNLRRRFGHFFLTITIFVAGSTLAGCRSRGPVTIAVIPRTSGTFLWEPMHVGAELAAQKTGLNIYWNAPTREDDIQGQITLLEKVVAREYKGLILAPDHELALITPV